MYLKAKTLPDAWFQAVWNLLEWDDLTNKPKYGNLYKIDQGSYEGTYRLEYPFITIEIEQPTSEPLLPENPENSPLPPVATMEYVYEYFNAYFMVPSCSKKEKYTYGSRINKIVKDGLPQLDYVLDKMEQYPHSNQLVLQIAEIKDVLLDDPPCMREIILKIIENRLDIHALFRSNDLVNGFPINLAAISLLMKYIHVMYPQFKCGKLIYFGSGLHIYDHAFEYVCTRCYKLDILEKLSRLSQCTQLP